MTVQVQGPDGNTYQFPDGTDKTAAIGYFKKKGIGAKAATSPAGDWRDPLTRTEMHQPIHSASDLGREVVRGVGNVGAGGLGVILRPVSTAEGIATTIAHPIKSAEALADQAQEHPLETAETMLGQAGASAGLGELAGKASGPAMRALKTTSQSIREGVTGTGPKSTGALVEKTQAGNAVADAHIRAQAAIETARENALKVGNQKYSGVNEQVSHLPADMEGIHELYQDASNAIGEAQSEPSVLTRLGKVLEHGDALTYKDEQALYSELGKELSKGTLPGGTYHAYDLLHEGLGADMQRIADSQGLGAELADARNYWRRMKQAFGKPHNPTDVASSVLRSQSPEMAEQGETANRIRLLGSFDPEIPKAFSDLQEARAKAKGVPSPAPGETTKIGPEEVRGAKADSLQTRAERIRSGGKKLANYGLGLKAMWDLYQGNIGHLGEDVATGVAAYKTMDWIAQALERPSVVEFLTKPTPRDIAEIPPELRSQFPTIMKEAKARGIKIDPRITAVLGITALNGPKAKKLQEVSDHYRQSGSAV